MEYFHWPAIALNRRRERFQRIDNNGRRRMSATVTEVARFVGLFHSQLQSSLSRRFLVTR
jgi:hypothetical protein